MKHARIDEYVNHEGFIRVAISGSDQDFLTPTSLDDIEDDPSTVLVVADEEDGSEHQIPVTVPDTDCDPCVLQVVRLVTVGGNFDDNDFQCADIVIESVAATAGSEDTGMGDIAAGTSSGADGTTGSATTDDSGGGTTGGPGGTSGTADGSSTAATTSGASAATASDESDGCGCHQSDPPRWALLGVFGLRRRSPAMGA